MAAPAFVGAGTGIADVGGNASSTRTGATVGNLIILQVLVDGTTTTGFTFSAGTGTSGVEALDGTDNTLTLLGSFDIASPAVGKQFLYIGRAITTTADPIGTPSGGTVDTYCRTYEFSGVHTGTTLAAVIENGSAGSTVNGVGNSTTVADSGVTTLGADRLACNFVAVNDDNVLIDFTSETGGDWTEAVAEFASATGTDGAIQLQTATIASAGTINGGTYTMVTDPWGVVGFALIPQAAAAPASLIYQPGRQAAIPRSLYVR